MLVLDATIGLRVSGLRCEVYETQLHTTQHALQANFLNFRA